MRLILVVTLAALAVILAFFSGQVFYKRSDKSSTQISNVMLAIAIALLAGALWLAWHHTR